MKKIATLLMAALFSHAAMAVPAYPARKTVTLADGTQVTLTLSGDEHLHYYKAPDGTPWEQLADGSFRTINADRMQLLRQKAVGTLDEAQARRAAKARHRAPLTGKKKGLVILVNFTDKYFSVQNPQSVFSDLFNKEGYREHGMHGSVRDYFRDQSYGQFELDFDVVGPYRLSKSMAYYGGPSGDYHDTDPQAMIEEAVQAADAHVDFTKYDWDGDGWVDQVYVVYAGYGENYGADANAIWPHESSIAYKNLTLDGKNIGTYACSCELKGKSGTTIDGIGTACHEFSHCLGIMDHYDTSGGGSYGMGAWDLMCSGNYNDGGCTPSGYTAYERWQAGWLEPTVIDEKTYITDMKPLEDAPEAYILYNDANRNEYYLLENRQKRGWDQYQGGHGLLVVHVDYDRSVWYSNTINANSEHQRMTIIPADNLLNDGSTSGDPFPGSGRHQSLTDTTVPAATLYNENTDGTFLMGKPLDDITETDDGRISFAAMRGVIAAPRMHEPQHTSPTSFRAAWTAVQDATSYEISVTERLAPYATPAEAMYLSEDFSKCYSKSVGLSNIGAKLDNYLNNKGWTGESLYTSPGLLRMGKGDKKGSITTPTLSMPNNGDLTIVFRAACVDATVARPTLVVTVLDGDKTLTGRFYYGNNAYFVVHASDIENDFRITLTADQYAYLNHFSIYDGDFNHEQLGLGDGSEEGDGSQENASPALMPRKLRSYEYTSPQAWYDFTDINPTSIYYYRVRAVTPYGYSKWSELITMDMNAANPVEAPLVNLPQDAAYYDLQGRRVAKPTRGIYIHDGKKVMVK